MEVYDALIDDNAPTTKDTIEDAVKELCDEEDMDDFFVSGVHGGSEVGIDAKHLSKYGAYHMMTPSGPLMQQLNMAHICPTQQ